MGRSLPAGLACAALLLLIVAPPTNAEHCATGISVYGRGAFAPSVLPPALPRGCVAIETSGSTGHVLLPSTAEIFVRVEADLGGSYPVLPLKLEGLGFHDQAYVLQRTQGVGNMWTYNLADWLPLPEPVPGDAVRATVRFPGNYEAHATYTLLGVPER